MSFSSDLINNIRSHGFFISDDNREVVCTSSKAENLYKKYYEGKSYILGNVPYGNENIFYIEYDILFREIEASYNSLSNRDYEYLHGLARACNDVVLFKEVVYDEYGKRGIFEDIVENSFSSYLEVTNELISICNELKSPSL